MAEFNIEQHPPHRDGDVGNVDDIADDRDDDAGAGGQIETKYPVLNDWNKIYRGFDFVSALTIEEIGRGHNASIRGAHRRPNGFSTNNGPEFVRSTSGRRTMPQNT